MKSLIVYDSVHGNTEKIAHVIGDALVGEAAVLRAGQVTAARLIGYDLLIIGAPTHGGRPTEPVQELLNSIPASALKGAHVAAFDTRTPQKWVRIFGYAAIRIADRLKKLGATVVAPPEGFFVKGTEGPLLDGEIERAAEWAKRIARSVG
jgi:flavodoxin I